VIIGGGPTGVEMAGAIAEIAHKTLFNNFRNIQPEQSEIFLFEGAPRLLSAYPEELSQIAKDNLEKMGVKVITHTHVTNITKDGIYIGEDFIPTKHVIWAAGNQASPLLKTLHAEQDRAGRVIVGGDLTIPGHPEIFIIGDAAKALDEEGIPLPGLAPVAIQQGIYAAKVIEGKIPPSKRKPFRYKDKGSMATIGKAKAVAVIGKRRLSGFPAWLAWCVIHIFYLISFPNRLIVMTQWFFWYLTGERYVRLIKRPIYEEE
jgi:NADH dehydrogenase